MKLADIFNCQSGTEHIAKENWKIDKTVKQEYTRYFTIAIFTSIQNVNDKYNQV